MSTPSMASKDLLELQDDMMQVYQALLARAENVTQVLKMRATIEALGGTLEIEPPTASGMVVVTLSLPLPYQPAAFFPGLPFYPL